MPMVGSAAEYERLALAALRKAGSSDADPTYHNTRAAIYATLAVASASETQSRMARKAARTETRQLENKAKAKPA